MLRRNKSYMIFQVLIKLLQIFFLPVSLLYGILMDIRNFLFDKGLLKTESFPVPVISIGNISAGGSGKTPLTMFLAEKLLTRYGSVAVISRGYGRKSTGFQLVSDGNTILLPPQAAGDEPALIAKRVRGSIVAVAEKRVEGIKKILGQFSPEVILLDDAFQHRFVKRDADIVLINQQDKSWPFPIPSGRLREFGHNIKRAHLILATNVGENIESVPRFGADYNVRSELGELIDHKGKTAGNISDLKGKSVFAFAGIAHPDLFLENLKAQGIDVTGFRAFSDHHYYEERDCQLISDSSRLAGCAYILCTEKDLVKFGNFQWDNLPFDGRNQHVLAVSQKLIIYGEEEFLQKIYRFIDIKKGMS